MSTKVSISINGANADLTVSTADGINILSVEVLTQLGEAVAQIAKAPHVRTLVIGGEGKVFFAGANIKGMSGYTPEQSRAYAELGNNVFDALAGLPCVTIAALNGAALGGGLELALACDFRIAVKSAKIGLPEVTLGLIPGWGGLPRLAALIGPARAKRLILGGHAITAEEGHTLGIIDEVVNSADDLSGRSSAFRYSFRQAAPQAIALAKRAMRDRDDVRAFVDCFSTTNAIEGMSAFLEKRKASWVEE